MESIHNQNTQFQNKADRIPATQESDAEYEEVERIARQLKAQRVKIPEQKTPKILICGKMGAGKSTTINTLFGKHVSEVGHYTRGTREDSVHSWEAHTENVNIVDLPGLGDSPKYDRDFKKLYRQHIPDADGFVIVVNPPRPAEEGTLRTIRLLLRNHVSPKSIVFAFNKLSFLHYPTTSGEIKLVKVDGLRGPATEKDLEAIDLARLAFFRDLQAEIRSRNFSLDQIVAYDSLTGWNLHSVLLQIIANLPHHSLLRMKRVAHQASRQAKKNEERRIAQAREALEQRERKLEEQRRKIEAELAAQAKKNQERIDKLEAEQAHQRRIREEREQLRKEREEYEARKQEDRLREIERQLDEERRLNEEREEALREFERQEQALEKTIANKILDGLGVVAQTTLKVAGKLLGKLFGGW